MFGQPEILLGIIPGGGGTQRLAHVVGAPSAKEMCLTGRQVQADEALRIGLADEVVLPEDSLDRAFLALAAEVAGRSPVGAGDLQADDRRRAGRLARRGPRAGTRGVRRGVPYRRSQIGVASFLEHGPGKATFT